MNLTLVQSDFDPRHLRLLLVNEGDTPESFIKPRVGFNTGGQIDANVFEFEGADVRYIGPYIKRLPYQEDEFHTLLPGDQAVALVDLSRYYALPVGQEVRVRYSSAWHPTGWELTSNWLTLSL